MSFIQDVWEAFNESWNKLVFHFKKNALFTKDQLNVYSPSFVSLWKGFVWQFDKGSLWQFSKGLSQELQSPEKKECFLEYTASCRFLPPLFPVLAQYSGPGETSLSLSNLPLLLNPSSLCSSHDWPMAGRWGVEARNSDSLQKARYPKRWRASATEYHLIRVRMPFSLIEPRRGGGE